MTVFEAVGRGSIARRVMNMSLECGGCPQQLVDSWRVECLRLSEKRRSSTRLARMYERLIAMAGQVRGVSMTG